MKTKRNKKEKKKRQEGFPEVTKISKRERKTTRRRKSQDKGDKNKTLSMGSSDDDETVQMNASADSDAGDIEDSFGEDDVSKNANAVSAKDLSLPPSIGIKKAPKAKTKKIKNFNSSATNLPTILPPGFGNPNNASSSNAQMNHLSLNITGYKRNNQKKSNQQPAQAAMNTKSKFYSKTSNADSNNRTIDRKKKNLPQGLQVAAMPYKRKDKRGLAS